MVMEQDDMNTKPKAYLVGGGIGSLAAAAFMIRDGKLTGGNITILETSPILGGSLDGAGDPLNGYSLRGGRMLTTHNYEYTWDLYKSIPSLNNEGQTVFDETVAFNEKYKSHSMARLVDSRRAKVPVTSMGFSMQDRVDLLKLSNADEDTLVARRITDWLLGAPALAVNIILRDYRLIHLKEGVPTKLKSYTIFALHLFLQN